MRIGPYTLIRQIGAGGMGVVYLGHGPSDPIRPSRPVAVKTMGQHLFSDPKEGARFLREAKITAQIQHPNVVATLDVIEQAGNVWHVMEFVNGVSAHAILRVDRELGRRIPVGVALRIFVDVLRGIAGAYDAQRPDGRPLRIVHRDISPQNVLVSEEDGVARVLDFGIAKTATHETTADSAGIRGKVRYIAPEQIKGLSAVHQSDIYSACVVAWELLAGRALFDGETLPVIVTRVLLGEIPRLRELRPDVPEALEALLRRGLSGDIRMRPSHASELAATIEHSFCLAERAEVAAYASACARAQASLGATNHRAFDTDTDAAFTAPGVRPAPSPAGLRTMRRRAWIPIAGVLAMIAAFSVTQGLRARAHHSASTTTEPAAYDPPARVVVASPSASSPEPSLPSPDDPPTTIASAPPAPKIPSATRARARARQAAAAASHSAGPDCRIPTYIDERGISRIRRECLP